MEAEYRLENFAGETPECDAENVSQEEYILTDDEYRRHCQSVIETRDRSTYDRYNVSQDVGPNGEKPLPFRKYCKASVEGGNMVRRLLDCESRMISICGKMKEMDEECRKVEKSIEINRKPFEEELRMAAQDFRNTEQEMTEYFKGIMTERDHRKDDTIDTFSILSAMRNSKTEELQSFLYEGYPEFSEINVRKALLKQLLFLCDCGSINAPLVITMACMEGMADEVEYNRHQVCFDDPQSYAELAVRRGNPIAERYYDEMTGSDREIEEALSRHEEDAFIYAGLAMRTVIIMKKRFRYKEAVKYAGLFERIADNCYIKNIAEMSVKRMKMLKKLLKYAVIILVLIRVLKHIFFSFGIPFLVCAILFLLTLFRNGKGELKKWLEL